MVSILQASFSSGEISPSLSFRTDTQKWASALQTCRNFMVLPYGGVKNRPGTVCVESESTPGVLIPFQAGGVADYVLHAVAGRIYVYFQGVRVTVDTTTLGEYSAATTYARGTRVIYSGIDEDLVVESLLDANTGNTPQSGFGTEWWRVVAEDIAPIPTSGLVPISLPNVYSAGDLLELSWAQTGDVLTIVHEDHPTFNVSRFDTDTWTIEEVDHINGPFQTLNVDQDSKLAVNNSTGVVTVSASKPVFDAGKVGKLLYLAPKIYQKPWQTNVAVSFGDIRRSDGKTYRAATAGTTGTLRPTHFNGAWSDGAVDWDYVDSGYGVARITAAATNGLSCTAEVTSPISSTSVVSESGVAEVEPESYSTNAFGEFVFTVAAGHGLPIGARYAAGSFLEVQTSLGIWIPIIFSGTFAATGLTTFVMYRADGNPIVGTPNAGPFNVRGSAYVYGVVGTTAPAYSHRWAFGSWGGEDGYPSNITYYQGRRVYAGSTGEPQTVWMSRTDSYADFSETSPLQDDDTVQFTLASQRRSNIRGLLAANKLLMLTSGGEWVLGTGQADLTTPSNISAKPQGFRGAAQLPMLGVGDTALFVQSKGGAIREMSYDFVGDKYTGADLSIWASHLLEGKSILQWAYQQHPYSIVWVITNTGDLLGMTYVRDQQIVAWHRHDTEGTFERITVVSEGEEDVLYAIVKRGNVYFMERMATRLVEDIEDGVFLDCSSSFDGADTATGTVTISLQPPESWDVEFGVSDLDNLTVEIENP